MSVMTTETQAPTIEQVAARFGCTIEQAREQYRANAADLSVMAEKAERLGRKVNGYDAGELRAMSAKMSAVAGSPCEF